MLVDEEGDIRLRRNEAETMSEVGETLIPCPRSLLEAIQGLVKTAYVVGVALVNKVGGLLTVDLLVKDATKEGILDVELVDRPRPRDGDAEDDPYRGRLDDGTEGLVEIDARLLREAANHPSCLVPSKAAIRVKLMFKDPLS
jgi:hypothetical protein